MYEIFGGRLIRVKILGKPALIGTTKKAAAAA